MLNKKPWGDKNFRETCFFCRHFLSIIWSYVCFPRPCIIMNGHYLPNWDDLSRMTHNPPSCTILAMPERPDRSITRFRRKRDPIPASCQNPFDRFQISGRPDRDKSCAITGLPVLGDPGPYFYYESNRTLLCFPYHIRILASKGMVNPWRELFYNPPKGV